MKVCRPFDLIDSKTLRPLLYFALALILSLGTAFGQEDEKDAAMADVEMPARQVPSFPMPSAREARIQRVLDTSTSVSWTDKGLETALSEIEKRHGIEIWIDKQALSDDGIDTEQEVTLAIKSIPLKKCLQLILEPLALTYVIEDEVLKITTQEKSNSSVATRVYPVGDLFDTAEEAKEFLETLECGLGINRELAGITRLAVSSRMKTLTVRDSRIVQNHVQELLLALRDAQPQRNHVPAPQY